MPAVVAIPNQQASAADQLTVVVVDGNPLIRLGIASMLEQTRRVRVVGEASHADRAVDTTLRLKPQVVLLDLEPPEHTNLAILPDLARHSAVLVLTSCTAPTTVHRAVRAGAVGYLIHGQFGAADLCRAVEAAARGEALLSPSAVAALVDVVRTHPEPIAASAQLGRLSVREIDIMSYIVRGLGNAEIARHLHLSEKTVRNHVNHIYAKLAVRTRAQAIATWLGTSRELP